MQDNSAKTPWSVLIVHRASGTQVRGVDRLRALHRWQSNARALVVTFDGKRVHPRNVDWTGFVVPPGRRGGPRGTAKQRHTEALSTRVQKGCLSMLDDLVVHTQSEHRGEYLSRVIRQNHANLKGRKKSTST